MKTNKKQVILFIVLFLLCSMVPISANSSWHWLTDTPLTMLPIAVVLTLLTEAVIICRVNYLKVMESIWAFIVITFANVVSFFAPYAFWASFPELIPVEAGSFFEVLNAYVSKAPVYTVGLGFLLLTLLVELPIVYFALRWRVKDKKLLLYSILAANTLTTILVSLIEHTLFYGSW
jgi:hypothetical protein